MGSHGAKKILIPVGFEPTTSGLDLMMPYQLGYLSTARYIKEESRYLFDQSSTDKTILGDSGAVRVGETKLNTAKIGATKVSKPLVLEKFRPSDFFRIYIVSPRRTTSLSPRMRQNPN